MPAFQGWIEPLKLPPTQIHEESVKNPNETSTHTSEELEDETSINGKKSTKKPMRESCNYLETTELVLLWKENLSIIESSRCNESWHFIQKEVSKFGHEKTKLQCKNKICNHKDLYKNAKLNRKERSWICKTDQRAGNDKFKWWIIFQEILRRDQLNPSLKKYS